VASRSEAIELLKRAKSWIEEHGFYHGWGAGRDGPTCIMGAVIRASGISLDHHNPCAQARQILKSNPCLRKTFAHIFRGEAPTEVFNKEEYEADHSTMNAIQYNDSHNREDVYRKIDEMVYYLEPIEGGDESGQGCEA
jgi:hypothetical protein